MALCSAILLAAGPATSAQSEPTISFTVSRSSAVHPITFSGTVSVTVPAGFNRPGGVQVTMSGTPDGFIGSTFTNFNGVPGQTVRQPVTFSTIQPVSAATPVQLQARATWLAVILPPTPKWVTASRTVTLQPPSLTSVEMIPKGILGGTSGEFTVALDLGGDPLPGDSVAVVSQNSSLLNVMGGQIPLSGRHTIASLTLQAEQVGIDQQVGLSFNYRGGTRDAGLTLVAPCTGIVQLDRLGNGQVRVSWPTNGVLYHTAALPGGWSALTPPFQTNATDFSVIRSEPAEFFRLRHVAADNWTAVTTNGAPRAREDHTAVWTGREMIVWGGYGLWGRLNDGGRYDPSTDTWTPVTTSGAPTARDYHTAVWTGSEMIVWGGRGDAGHLNDGGRYNPVTDTWTPVTTSGAPTARYGHTAAWTGSEMIVWGGNGDAGDLNDGGRYNPVTDTWRALATSGAPTFFALHKAIWTGSEMIVWGGYNHSSPFNAGARYNPKTDAWTPVATSGAPEDRSAHTALWTGSEMIVWGGISLGDYVSNGGRFHPGTDTWTPVTNISTPAARGYHTAVWTGSEMIVWGGLGLLEEDKYPSDGGRYNPRTDTWTPVATIGAPTGRSGHTAVWTGSEMIVWGGIGKGKVPSDFFARGGARYNPGKL